MIHVELIQIILQVHVNHFKTKIYTSIPIPQEKNLSVIYLCD